MDATHMSTPDLEAFEPPQSPSLPPLRNRTPTVMSSSSAVTQISMTISTMAQFTCHKCHGWSSSLQTLRFTRRNSFLNPLRCAICQEIVLQLGGPKIQPSPLRQLNPRGHGLDEAESSIARKQHFSPADDKFEPNMGRALEAAAVPFAAPWSNTDADSRVPSVHFADTVQDMRHETCRESITTHAARSEGSTTATNSMTVRPRYGLQRFTGSSTPKRFHQLVRQLPRTLLVKFANLKARVDTPSSLPGGRLNNKGMQPQRTHGHDASTEAASPYARSDSSPATRSNSSQQCESSQPRRFSSNSLIARHQPWFGSTNIEKIYDRNHDPNPSERSLDSPSRLPRPEPINRSHVLLGMLSGVRDRFSRLSSASSDAYSSRLSFGLSSNRDRSRSRAPLSPRQSTHLASPQLPHHRAYHLHEEFTLLPPSLTDSGVGV